MSKARTLANFVSAGNPLSDGTIAASELTGTLAVANGGTGQTTYTDGQVLIGNTTGNTLTKASLTAGTGITITPGAGSISIAANNAGTVTSVTGTSPVASSGGATPAISLTSGYGDTLNPYASKTANFVLAAPNGSAGVPTFRAVVAADIPTLNQSTTGNATSATNLAGGSNGTIPYQSASGTTQMLAVGTAGQLLQTNGAGAPSWVAAPSTAPAGSTGQVQYNNAGAFGAISEGTAGQILTSGGAGVAPSFATPAGGGSLILLQNYTGTNVDTIDVTGYFTSTYKFYKLYVNMRDTNLQYIYIRLFINGTLSTASAYGRTAMYVTPGGGVFADSYSSSQSYIDSYIAGKNMSFEYTFFDPSDTNNRNPFWMVGTSGDSGGSGQLTFGTAGLLTTGTAGARAITGVRLTTFGTPVNWTAQLYGIKPT